MPDLGSRRHRRFQLSSGPSARGVFKPVEPLEPRTLFAGSDLDPSFSGDGLASIGYVGSGEEWATAAETLADGRLLVGGRGEETRGVLARYLPDGRLDPAFGQGGRVAPTAAAPLGAVLALAVFPDGSFLASFTQQGTNPGPALLRFTPSGAPDPAWVGPAAGLGQFTDLVALADGSSLAVFGAGVVKLNPNGTHDTSFGGGDGIIQRVGQGSAFNRAAVQSDGRIILASQQAGLGANPEAAIYRFSASGDYDGSFGEIGRTVLQRPGGVGLLDLIVGAGDRILVGGSSGSESYVARLTAGGQRDANFGNGGARTFDVSTQFDSVFTLLEAADASVVMGGASTGSGATLVPDSARLTPTGAVDAGFGGNGIVEQPLPAGWVTKSAAHVEFAPDGRVLMASGGAPSLNSTNDLLLTRHTADGSRDATFGGAPEGVVRTDFPRPAAPLAGRSAVQADGKVVHTGASSSGDVGMPPGNFLVARMNADGTPDTAFGTRGDGVVEVDFGEAAEFASDVAVQPDGKLVIVGQVRAADGEADYGVARLNPDGTLDASFGTGGKVRSHLGGRAEAFTYVAIQDDMKILAAGSHASVNGAVVPAVVRFLPDGNLDPAFGLRSIDLPGAENIASITPLPGGGVLVAGGVEVPGALRESGWEQFVARLTPTGAFDSAFGPTGAGYLVLPGPLQELTIGAVVGADGRIYLAGLTHIDGDLTLTRLTDGGVVDGSFGTGGTQVIPLLNLGRPRSFIATPRGQFLLAGTYSRFYVMRLNADGAPDAAFGNNGVRTVDFGTPFDAGIDVHQDAAGRIVVTGARGFAGTLDPGDWAAARLVGDLDTTPPAITSARLDLAAGRHALRLAFSEDVAGRIAPGDFVLENTDTGQRVTAFQLTHSGDVGGPTTYEWKYTGPASTLPNGNYRFTLPATAVTDTQGNAMAQGFVLRFFVLTGDVNQDRRVDGADFAILAGNFGKTGMTAADGDLNGDGAVNGSDFALLAGNFGRTVPAAVAVVTTPPAAAVTTPARAPSPVAPSPLAPPAEKQPQRRAAPKARPRRRLPGRRPPLGLSK